MNQVLTIITPTYNRANTLPRVFESLKNQTFKNFVWLVMDDGSTDNTQELIEQFTSQANFPIQYHYHDNKHKFITVFKGIEKVKTPYFVIVDSDDAWPNDAFETLVHEVEKIKNQDDFIGVIGHSVYPNGEIVGDKFPLDQWDGSILEMRQKHRISGDKNGIFITKTYQNELKRFNYTPFDKQCYIPQTVFFTTYDAKGIKTRFVNKVIRTYFLDEEDENSVTNTRRSGKNLFGLLHGSLSILNNYQSQLFQYPKYLIRNTIGALFYGFKQQISPWTILSKIKYFPFKLLAFILLVPTYFYYLIKK